MVIENEDLMVLSHLRKNARSSLVAISQETNIPQSTLYEKLRNYEQTVIKKHTCLLQFEKLGYNVEIKMAIKAKKSTKHSLLSYIKAHQNVNSAFYINGGYDYFVECVS